MENRRKMSRWTIGYLIYLSLLLTVNHFVKFSVNMWPFIIGSIVVYFGLYAIKSHKKATLRIVLVIAIIALLIYGIDFLLSTYHQYSSKDVLIGESVKTSDPSGGQAIRHNVPVIHELRDFIDYKKVIDYGQWLGVERVYKQLYSGESIETRKNYEFFTFILVNLLGTLLIGLIYETKWLKVLLAMPLFLYVWLWYLFIDMPWHITAIYFAGVVAFFIMDHQEKLLKSHDGYNTSYYKVRNVTLGSLGVAGIVVLISGVLMLGFPIRQVNQIVDLLTPNLWGARSGYENDRLKMYTLRETAFQESSDILGGPVGPINMEDPIFWVNFDRRIDDAVYLRTVVKDYYDGLRWINNSVVYKNSYKYYLSDDRNVEMLKAGAYDSISGMVRVNRKLTKTVTLFTPMGLVQTSLGNDQVYVSTESEAFFKSGAFVQYLNEYSFLATQRDFYYDDEKNYLQLPDRIDPRTYELALSIGEMGETNYDKITRMTQFLSENYTYSLTPPSNRDRNDFVSSFLFDTKKGYCTYFASALTVMARINGIPARYVEGFRVDPNEVVYGDFSKVTERDAHAWAEVYLEDYGWVIFESTPIFSEETSLEGTPTLEEILGNEDDEDESDVEASPGASGRDPFDLDELLAEYDGGRGDFRDIDSPAGGQAELPRASRYTLLYVALVILLLIAGIMVAKLPILYLRKQATHAYAIRLLYLLAYLISEAKGYTRYEPEYVLARASFKESDIRIWMKLLYDRKDRVSTDMVLMGIEALEQPIKEAKLAYKAKKGKLAYYRFRLFDIAKIIP